MADDDVDALFDLGVDEFVAARDRLAAGLRQAGDRAGADAVRKLRRPTVVAWVLNQLARRHTAEVVALLALGRQAAAAQHQALAGDAAELRDVDRRRRAAVAVLVEAAGGLVGGGRARLDEVEASLLAASLDPEGQGAPLREGRLSAAIPAASGFDLALAGWSPAAGPAPSEHRRSPADAPPPGGNGPSGRRSGKDGPSGRRSGKDGPSGRRSGKDGDDGPRRARDERRQRVQQEARRRADELGRAADVAEQTLAELGRELVRLQARLDEAHRRAQDARRRAQEARRPAGEDPRDQPEA